MILTFTPEKHEYKSLDEDIDWISVTHFVSHLKQPFNAKEQAIKSSKNKRSKWYGMDPEKIQEFWKDEGNRATGMGTWYHDQREKDLMEFITMDRHGTRVPIIRPIYKDGVKIAPEQKLISGVYPEHFIYLKSAGLCGQSDRVEVVNNLVDISDYKTNKEIKLEGYTNWEGVTTMMTGPVSHLPDCHIVHYGLQLSLYLYMILKHNPNLVPGKLTIEHIKFEESDKDPHGYPIYKKDDKGNFIVKDVTVHMVPYYKTEVISLLSYLKENRELVKSKKR